MVVYWQQAIVCVLSFFLFIGIVCLGIKTRGKKIDRILTAVFENRRHESMEYTDGINKAYVGITSTAAVTLSLFLTIQFSGLFAYCLAYNIDNLVRMLSISLMFNGILSSLIGLIVSIHLSFLMCIFNDSDLHRWLGFRDNSYMMFGDWTGQQLLMLIVFFGDQGVFWLMASFGVVIIDLSILYSTYFLVAGWFIGFCVVEWVSMISYGFFYRFYGIT